MKKRGYILVSVLALVLLSSFAFGQVSEYGDEFALATQCLDNEIKTTQTLTLEEAVFSVLAGSTDGGVLSKIDGAKHSSEECWPNSGCNIKETAQVALAKQARGENIDGILDWLKEQTETPGDLLWYLQITIDNNREAECTISEGGSSSTITVHEDLTLSGGGNCFNIDENGFWLRISESCVDKEFEIGCDWVGEGSEGESFLTNLVYRERVGGTTFVSSSTESSPNGGLHKQKISAECFSSGSGCDYEGSLWATTAIHRSNEETTNYVPYLLGLADSNQQYFPEAFLKFILGWGNDGDQFDAINSKVSNGHWDITGGYSAFVDTGLAIIAFGGGDSVNIKNYGTFDWLFSQATEEGCFNNNNIRDTAFIIYAAQVRGGSGVGGGGSLPPGGLPGPDQSCQDIGGTCGANCTAGETSVNASCTEDTQVCCLESVGGGDDTPFLDNCELEGYFCGDRLGCITGGGQVVDQYSCSLFSETCCTVAVQLDTCGSMGGEICSFDEECSAGVVQAGDGACCVDGTCRKTEDDTPPSTPTPPPPDEPDEGISMWVWIIILLVLIGMAVLGIVFKDKIRMWLFKRKGRVKTSRVRPGGTPVGPITGRKAPPSFGPPPGAVRRFRGPVRRPVGRRDKEMDETLKKLKEMSK